MKGRLLTILLVLISVIGLKAGGYTITTFDYSWVTASYPTSYVSGNFSLNGTGADSFEKNKSGRTFIIDLPAGFEFNTSAASDNVAATGSGNISSVSFAYTSSTRLTVTYSTINSNIIDTLFFTNIEIRATAAGSSGTMIRNGGTAKVKGGSGAASTSNPTSLEPFGTFTADAQMVYSSSAVTQPTTTDVNQYSSNNEGLTIEIVTTNSGNAIAVTQFDLDTDGGNGTGSDDPSNDLTNVKIWYTGTSSTFATTTLFGSYGSAPNGTFVITGNVTLAEGSNYFWVTFDVAGDANTTNSIDFSVDGITIDGSNETDMSTPTPTGKRDIAAATFYYAISDGNWSSTSIWSATDNGSSCSCSPNGSGVVIIDTNMNVTLDDNRTVDVVEIHDGGDVSGAKELTVNNTLKTFDSGFFALTKDMNVGSSLELSGTGTSSAGTQLDVDGDLIIGSGTTLSFDGSGGGAGAGNNLFVGGNLIINGTLDMSANGDLFLDGGILDISGTGSITNSGGASVLSVESGNKEITSGSNLTVAIDFDINGAYTITNNGTIELQADLTGTSSSSTWTQGSGSTLKIGGALLTTGTLNASASGNIVNYNGSGAQTIKTPSSSYYDLTVSTGGTKTLAATIDVDNDLTISTGTTLDVSASNYNINVQGDWDQDGTFTAQSGAVSFDSGTSPQIITGSATPAFYTLIMNNAVAGITLNTGVDVNNSLLMLDGDVDLNGNTLTLDASATITGETNDNRIKGSGGITITLDINAPSGLNVGGMGVELTASDNLGSTTVTRGHDAQTGGGNQSIERYFDISPTNNSGLNVTMVYNYFENELNGQDESGLILYRSTDGGVSWDNEGGVVNTASNFVTITGISAFSRWAASNASSSPLPVELLYFDSECDNQQVQLNWATATETNSDQFLIYYSLDGAEFIYLGSVSSNGNSLEMNHYTFDDAAARNGDVYYALYEQDVNANEELLAYTIAQCELIKNNIGFNAYVDNGLLRINSFQGFEGLTSVKVYSIAGRLLISDQVDCSVDMECRYDLGYIDEGLLLVEISNANQKEVLKVIYRK